MARKQEQAPAKPVAPTPPPAPGFKNSVVRMGGKDVARSFLDPSGQIVTEYIGDPAEDARKQQRQALIDDYEKNINVFDPAMNQQFDDTANAFREKNQLTFDDMFDETSRKTREDTASRFGNLDSSIYRDQTKDLEQIRADEYANIARDSQLLRGDLKDQELGRRYNYLNFLTSGLNNAEQTAQNYYNNASQSSNMLNDFNRGIYGTQSGNFGTQAGIYGSDLNSYNQELNRRAQERMNRSGLWSKILGGALGIGGLAAKFRK